MGVGRAAPHGEVGAGPIRSLTVTLIQIPAVECLILKEGWSRHLALAGHRTNSRCLYVVIVN
jgi:hypothetical protein